jgi:hypothetical protein
MRTRGLRALSLDIFVDIETKMTTGDESEGIPDNGSAV